MIVDGVSIPLRKRNGDIRAYATVDVSDAAFLNQWKWFAHRTASDGRLMAARRERVAGKNKVILMHRVLMGLPLEYDGREVDHINHDTLNNCRFNLRVATHAQNLQNKRAHRGSTSAYRGVHWDIAEKKWHAEARTNGHTVHLGRFDSETEAAAAAAQWRSKHFPFAVETYSHLPGAVPLTCQAV